MTAKQVAYDAIGSIAADLRRQSQQVVFTNGCFDILHAGHVHYLAQARAAGDILIVGLNSDTSVKAIKGPQRPIVTERYRADALAGLTSVDHVVVFHQTDPLALIQLIKPDILVKGADWPEDKIIGADYVKSCGGRVLRIELLPGISTTHIIRKILSGCQTGHS